MKVKLNLCIAGLMAIIFLLTACNPKTKITEAENLEESSKSWIPFEGYESLVFSFEDREMVFTSSGRETYYENIRYMSDQSGFFYDQRDYYADFEREVMIFESTSTSYILKYYLERNRGENGSWDIYRVSVIDDEYYKNEVKLAVFKTDKLEKGENFRFDKLKKVGTKSYNNVYYWKQDKRPFEVYFTKKYGIIGFKIKTDEIWTLNKVIEFVSDTESDTGADQ